MAYIDQLIDEALKTVREIVRTDEEAATEEVTVETTEDKQDD